MTDFYNEIDKDAAAWLRELIAEGHIAPGIVDERSIEDVRPDELVGFTKCHFFAGIGIWPLALRAAGIPDDFPIWTGSCPCQPFSSAGKGDGFADERHLWPAWYHLISQCRPTGILGEQVASKDAGSWIDLVHADVEALGYAFGCVPFPSAGVGAPHIRDRAYWVANAADQRLYGRWAGGASDGRDAARLQSERLCDAGGLGNTNCKPTGRITRGTCRTEIEIDGAYPRNDHGSGHASGGIGGMAHADMPVTQQPARERPGPGEASVAGAHDQSDGRGELPQGQPAAGPTNGLWADADWLFCRDGKWRPVEPGTQPLAYGLPRSMGAMSPELQRLASVAGLSKASLKRAKQFRVGSLRGYGNAINAKAAQAFIESVMEAP